MLEMMIVSSVKISSGIWIADGPDLLIALVIEWQLS